VTRHFRTVLLLASTLAVLALPAAAGAQNPQADSAAAAARVVPIEEVQTPPDLKNRAEAASAILELYPQPLRDARVGGRVTVRFVVDEQGLPAAIRVEASGGRPELDQAAMRVAERMRFDPARRGGAPAAVWVTLPITFKPPPAPEAPPPGAAEPAKGGGGLARPDSLGAYEVSTVAEVPQMLNRESVARALSRAYPPLLRDQGIEGRVLVRFVVDEQGRPDHLRVARSSGQMDFDQAALFVVRQARFRPARLNGRPVRVWVTLPVNFEVEIVMP
jgi:TonB family protein